MASQNRTSVVSDIVKVTFRAKASMSDAHWKEIGAVLQRANEKRLSVVYQPSVDQPESKQPGSENMAKSSNSAHDGLCALLRSGSHR